VNILVTGGAGFIGSHLVDHLVSKKHNLIVLDNLSTGELSNIKQHIESGRIVFIEGDIRNSRAISRATRSVDAIIHLAALISVEESKLEPILYHQVNVTGTLKLLKAAVKSKVKHFIFTSSAAVYGNPVKLPINENHPLNPISIYGATKIAAEQYIKTYSNLHGLKTTILRIFNAYGPRQKYNPYAGVITIFINNALNNKPLIIYGDGNQTRDFIYVKDVAKAIELAIESQTQGIFNIATGKPTTINQLASTIRELVNPKIEILHDKPRPGDIYHSYADVSKAEKELGFKAKIELREGLIETIEYMRKQILPHI